MTSETPKQILIKFMQSLNFHVDDVSVIDGEECILKRMHDDPSKFAVFHISEEGSGFNQLFKGSIRKVCQ